MDRFERQCSGFPLPLLLATFLAAWLETFEKKCNFNSIVDCATKLDLSQKQATELTIIGITGDSRGALSCMHPRPRKKVCAFRGCPSP